MRSIRAMPPMGSKVTSGVAMPKRRAIRIWPNSWATTHAKRAATKTTFAAAAVGPPSIQAAVAIQRIRRKKVA
jgi:hypothetical protein